MSIRENRAKVIAALRNSGNWHQISSGVMFDGQADNCCALGLMYMTLYPDYDYLSYGMGNDRGKLYEELKEGLDLDYEEVWRRNDQWGMSFAEIADYLSYRWGM